MGLDQALRQKLLERVVADAPDGIIAVDRDDHVALWNEGARRMFGYVGEEMLGRLWTALLPPAGPERREYRRIRERLARDGRVDNVKTVRVAKDGHRVRVLLTRTLLYDEAGEVLGSAIVTKDLAHLEEVERRMARADRLAAIGQLVAHLAHEVRNPLNAVVLNCEMLRSHLEAKWPRASEGLREHLEIMEVSLDVLECSVRDFLRLAREAPGRPGPVSFPQVVDRVVRLLGSEAAKREIRLTVSLPDDFPPVLGDQARIEHILINLVRNAMEAIHSDGEVRITARGHRRRVSIRVLDNGPGMDEATRRRAFIPFFSTKSAGAGLGLAIVERLIHELNGDVRCESIPGKRTTFTVILPAVRGGAS